MTSTIKRKKIFMFPFFILAAILIISNYKKNSSSDSVQNSSWNLILVNNDNALPKNFTPSLTELSNGQKVDKRAYPDLQNMFDDMRKGGLSPEVTSGYRSKDKQQSIMDNKISEYVSNGYPKIAAKKLAKDTVAEPGHSEHETGLAMDVNASSGINSQNIYTWLAKNSYKYGFIIRYPDGKKNITGISYEPWHIRYVGKDDAKAIHDSGLTLEEYVKKQ